MLLTLQEAGEITLFSLETKSLYSDEGWGGQREREFVGTGMVVVSVSSVGLFFQNLLFTLIREK